MTRRISYFHRAWMHLLLPTGTDASVQDSSFARLSTSYPMPRFSTAASFASTPRYVCGEEVKRATRDGADVFLHGQRVQHCLVPEPSFVSNAWALERRLLKVTLWLAWAGCWEWWGVKVPSGDGSRRWLRVGAVGWDGLDRRAVFVPPFQGCRWSLTVVPTGSVLNL